jgi:hypothetical protein
MARIVLGGLTTLNLATHLDAQFVDLYGLRELIATPGYAGTMPYGTFDSNGNFGVGTGTMTERFVAYSIPGSANAIGVYRDFDVTAGGSAGVAMNMGARLGATRTVAITQLAVLESSTSSYLTWSCRTGSGVAERLRLTQTSLQPGTDNAQTCGTSGMRWSVVYAATGAINTSDSREKSKVSPLEDRELAASIALGKEIGAFKFLSSMREKGDSARIHIGMTVQRAMEVMSAHGLNATDYAFICHDVWPAREVPAQTEARDTGLKNSNGEPIMETVTVREGYTDQAGDRYGFRMDQLALFIMRGIEHRLTALEGLA